MFGKLKALKSDANSSASNETSEKVIKELKKYSPIIASELKKVGITSVQFVVNDEKRFLSTVKNIYGTVIPLIPSPFGLVVRYGLSEETFVNYCLGHRPVIVELLANALENEGAGVSNNMPILNDSEAYERLKIFIKLIKSDGVIDKEELKFINEIIDSSSLNKEQRSDAQLSLINENELPIDYGVFVDQKVKSLLMEELIFIAKLDNDFSEDEKSFIQSAGLGLGFSEVQISEMLS